MSEIDDPMKKKRDTEKDPTLSQGGLLLRPTVTADQYLVDPKGASDIVNVGLDEASAFASTSAWAVGGGVVLAIGLRLASVWVRNSSSPYTGLVSMGIGIIQAVIAATKTKRDISEDKTEEIRIK